MASSPTDDNPARHEVKQLRAFQELFRGRFSTDEAAFLLEKFQWNSKAAATFVMAAEPGEITKMIEEDKGTWTEKRKKEDKKKVASKIASIKQSSSLLEGARLGRINTSARLYACGPCDYCWWRRTPQRKEVSKCYRCGVRYDPVPRAMEWGWALFKCPRCQNEFSGYCGMWMTSPCYSCGDRVQPFCIQPPNSGNRPRRTNKTHRCDAPDCQHCGARPSGKDKQQGGLHAQRGGLLIYVRDNSEFSDGDLKSTDPGSVADYNLTEDEVAALPSTCIHPSTRLAQNLPRAIHPSKPHDSTGSTVDTFLSQGDLGRQYEIILETIDEGD